MDQRQKQYILNTIRNIKRLDEQVYLVGGAVRDQILGLPIHDLDFAVKDNPELLARKFANNSKAGYYVLDDLRHTARVVMKTNSDETTTLDFAKFRGYSILEDLKSRDFTVNAIAEDLDHPGKLVDPLEGMEALEKHQLRLCSPAAFEDDPIRVLRAVRFSLKFHLAIDPALMINMKKFAPMVLNPSKERQRDEFFQILALDQVNEGIRLLDDVGIIDLFLPQISPLKEIYLPAPSKGSVWDHTRKGIRGLDMIHSWIKTPEVMSENTSNLGQAFILILKDYLSVIRDYLKVFIIADRDRGSLLAFAALLQDVGVKTFQSVGSTQSSSLDEINAEFAMELAGGFALGRKEQDFIRKAIANRSLPEKLTKSINPMDKRAIYKFFQTTGIAGIAVCLLALVDLMVIHEFSVPTEKWTELLAVTKALFNAWWVESEKSVNVRPLLTGDDLKNEFHIKEGPRIGILLESLKEEQASGAIKTRAKALAFMKKCIESEIWKK